MKLNLLSITKICLFLAVGAVGLSACGDDDSGAAPDNRNKTQLLTDAGWKTTLLKYDSVGTTADEDIFATFDQCDKDDVHKFNAASSTSINGTYIWTEGATKCDPSFPDTVGTETWEFANTDQTKLRIPSPVSNTIEWDIVELNASSLKLRHTSADNEVVDWHFTH